MGLTSALEMKAEVLGSTHDRLNTGLGELCRRYMARYMNTTVSEAQEQRLYGDFVLKHFNVK